MTKKSKFNTRVVLVALVPILTAMSLPATAAGIDIGKPMKIGKFDLSTKGIIKGVAKGVIVGAIQKLRRR